MHYPFVNPPLPYNYDALESFIDTKTMELHHDRHLQTYIDNLNNTLKDCPRLQTWSLTQLLMNQNCIPEKLQTAVKNNAGGVYNHIFFFNGMQSPEKSAFPVGKLSQKILCDFGSYENFFSQFKTQSLSVFGSGYAWLVTDTCHNCHNLRIVTTKNQDTPLTKNLCPILAIDVWEHAYYLKHYNKRADYIDDWFKVINWEQAEKNYLKCNCFS